MVTKFTFVHSWCAHLACSHWDDVGESLNVIFLKFLQNKWESLQKNCSSMFTLKYKFYTYKRFQCTDMKVTPEGKLSTNWANWGQLSKSVRYWKHANLCQYWVISQIWCQIWRLVSLKVKHFQVSLLVSDTKLFYVQIINPSITPISITLPLLYII